MPQIDPDQPTTPETPETPETADSPTSEDNSNIRTNIDGIDWREVADNVGEFVCEAVISLFT
jgi:hypothetical protein